MREHSSDDVCAVVKAPPQAAMSSTITTTL